ncbi:elongator complex protein 1 [Uranotaenia lowii]|uniref:elongator complex protein 1 n=1 Tax=Uranotaenia lowii TaxID=190385 RepID=UPI002479EAC6|nr:elongator complex protein 1 [Uranotaenia lowii]
MRNLYRQSYRYHRVPSFEDFDPSSVTVALDSNREEVLYMVARLRNLPTLMLYRVDEHENMCRFQLFSPPNDVVGLEHLSQSDMVCVATEGGEVMLVPSQNEKIVYDPDCATFCCDGLRAMAWSPSQEIVVFVDSNLKVVTMNADYDTIGEVNLKENTFGDREFMSVGWGKKETQFHGSEGKEAASRNKKEEEQMGHVDLETVDQSVVVSWRADGELFAVGFAGPFGRAFKVLNREGALQFTSEKCFGLETPLAWKPSGSWIAMPQVVKETYVMALFEKNGLRHREFELPFRREEWSVTGLHWSNDSDVLVVQTSKNDQTLHGLYFYVITNYEWNVKQYLEYDSKILFTGWDMKYSVGRTLHVVLDYGQYEVSRWDFRIDHSVGKDSSDAAIVAVIHDCTLKLTNFRGAVVPPPMCSYPLNNPHRVNAVSFLRVSDEKLDSNCLFVVDYANRGYFYKPVFSDGPIKILQKMQMLGNPIEMGSGHFSHWTWVTKDLVAVMDEYNCVNLFTLANKNGETVIKTQDKIRIHETPIICMEAVDHETILFFGNDGSVYRLIIPDALVEEQCNLPEFCDQMYIRLIGDEHFKVYALRKRQNLYVDDQKVASNVTSMFLTEQYLLFTTISELKFLDLQTDTVVDERRIERGAKLVIVVPGTSRTIFQLPRGNLEAVAPRVLSLRILFDQLDNLEYPKAFETIRRERINLNVIVDHNPELFLANIDHFINSIPEKSWLNIFITELQNQDVCRDMYSSTYRYLKTKPAIPYKMENKVEFLCDRMLQALQKGPQELSLLYPIVTCHVKKGNLEVVLRIIWKNKQVDKSGTAEKLLKYLLYMVDVNKLFNEALGMYDFGLVLFVATQSQKDPKEYLPFLNELKQLDENYRKFRIDCHLKRYEKAIEHIALYRDDDEKFNEALQVIVIHGLYAKAINCYRGITKYYQQICAKYGDNLRQSNKQLEASLMYEKAGDLHQAIASARNGVEWERCMKLASMASFSEEDTIKLVNSLIPALTEAGNYEAAAKLARDWLKNSRLAVDILLKDNLFEKALTEAHFAVNDQMYMELKFTFNEEIKQVIFKSLQQYLQTLAGKLAEEQAEFLKYKNRLQVVRVERANKKVEPNVEEDDGRDVEDCDLYSDASTVASSQRSNSSGRSGKSHLSSKNRRKHERKLFNLKEGNPYEDIALVNVLHGLVHKICGLERQRHIRDICKVAIELDLYVDATIIQRSYGNLFQLVRYSLDAIWIPEMIVRGSGQDVEETAAITGDLEQVQNAQHYALIVPHQRYKPEIQSIPWQFDLLK